MRQNWSDTRSAEQKAADLAACDLILRTGSKSFRAAALLLPLQTRLPATALYAFCRLADDAIDEGPGDAATIGLLEARVEAAYSGRPYDHPVDRAFSQTVRDFALPQEIALALIEGLSWDARGERYETLDDLCDYAARVAGSVGVMMTTLMHRRAPEVLARAADLGVAMQLSNIARDVGTDARMGRIYLPLSWLREAGIDPDAFLARPVFTPALGAVVARLLAEADRLYARPCERRLRFCSPQCAGSARQCLSGRGRRRDAAAPMAAGSSGPAGLVGSPGPRDGGDRDVRAARPC